MTPSAVTPAARQARDARARPASPHPSTPRPSHRVPLQRSAPPRSPRRVSGPARTAPARPAPARPAPARRAPARAPRRPAPAVRAPLAARSLAYVRALPDHSLLDRIVRGRLWIPLLGVLLVGIVAMQVEVLKLNAGIGHSMVRSGQLQASNQLLRADVARLSDDQRIESAATQQGMTMPSSTATRFLTAGGAGAVAAATANIHQPDAAGFAARLSGTSTSSASG